MKVLVSACLLGENCKYDGGNNYSSAVEEFAPLTIFASEILSPILAKALTMDLSASRFALVNASATPKILTALLAAAIFAS